MSVRHEEARRAFLLEEDGGTGELTYTTRPGIIDLDHTFVPETLPGSGAGGKLARAALEHARKAGFKVVPTCPFVDAPQCSHGNLGLAKPAALMRSEEVIK